MGMKGIEACGVIVKELGLDETGEDLYKRRSAMLVTEFPKVLFISFFQLQHAEHFLCLNHYFKFVF